MSHRRQKWQVGSQVTNLVVGCKARGRGGSRGKKKEEKEGSREREDKRGRKKTLFHSNHY